MSAEHVSKAIGIDLGTTNSAVAIMDPTDTAVIIHRDSSTRAETTPSCIWKDPVTGAITVGRGARKRLGTAPGPVRSIKRLIGREETVRLTDEDVSPEQASALILAEMKRQIEADVQTFATAKRSWIVDRAVVTVPAYFDQPSVEATRHAVELAGLEVVDLLHEPTAAASYHCWRTNTANGLFLVYDLGGGTFDVAILRSTAGKFEVLGISGNNRLGGDDLDVLVAELLHERLTAAGYPLALDAGGDEAALGRVLLARMGENVKIGLSQSGEYVLRDAMGLRDANGHTIDGFEAMFERAEVDALVLPTLERTIAPCFDALEQAQRRAGVTLADVDAIVLAGGATHMPIVRELVRRNLCALEPAAPPPREGELADPRADTPRAKCAQPLYERVDAIVALGAAVRASAHGGLAVYDTGGRVRVAFRGAGVTSDERTHVGGRVEALEEGLDLAGGSVRLRIPAFGYEDADDLDGVGGFGFRGLPLQRSAENELLLEVKDAADELVATVTRSLTQNPLRPTLDPAAPARLAKPLRLEVMRDGRRQRYDIVEAMTALPHSCEHTLAHPGGTELVMIALYQLERMIRCIHVPVPSSLPAGTPVWLRVSIDELLLITVEGSIDASRFSAVLSAPPVREAPTDDDLAALERDFAEARSYLQAGAANVADQRWQKARQAHAAAVARGDAAAMQHEFEQLEDLVASIVPAGPLRPPKAEFDDKVAEVLKLNDHVAAGSGGTYDGVDMRRSIDVHREAGERAWAAEDQAAYSDAFMALDGAIRFLRNKHRGPAGEERSREERAVLQVDAVERELRAVDQLAQAGGHAAIEAQLARLAQQASQLRARATTNPSDVSSQAAAIVNDLDRIRSQLSTRPSEAKLPVVPGAGR